MCEKNDARGGARREDRGVGGEQVDEPGRETDGHEARASARHGACGEADAAVDADAGAGAEDDRVVDSDAHAEEGARAAADTVGPAEAGEHKVARGGRLGVVGRQGRGRGRSRWRGEGGGKRGWHGGELPGGCTS